MVVNVVKLGDVATISAGQSAPKSNYFCEEGIPFVRAGSLEFLERGESIDLCEKISEDNAQICRLKLYPKNSILFAKSGMSANKGRIYKLERNAYIVSHLAIITPDETKLIPEYLMYWLQKHPPKTLIKDESYPSIGLTDIANMEIELPPLDKQKKIAKILDKADEIRAKKKLANDKLDEFLKSTFISMFGNPETNDKHWGTGTIRDIVKEAKYGTSSKARSEGTYPILRMGNLTYEGAITLDDLKYIDLKDNELEKYLVKQGDILFNRTNSKELVGKTAVYRYEQPMAFAGYLVRVRTNEKANAEFLSAFMNSDYMKRILQLKCKNIVGMANINAQELQDFNIYIPPMELQNKFAKIVEKVEAQKQKNELVIEQMNNLFNSLSQRAFKGDL